MNDLYSVITDSDSVNVMLSGKFMRGGTWRKVQGARAWAPAGIFPGGGPKKSVKGGPYKLGTIFC